MALDDARRSLSPPGSSGRDSPVLRPSRRVLEDEPRRGDKSYRRYAAGIERALASFDNARQEWADYISFLGRLLKAIQAHPTAVDTLPHKVLVANRLSQCLSPSLPSGVHQKAIEVYSYIFSLIGKEALAHDLPIYLPGISPVLSFASLTLRPSVLSLFETHILSLDAKAIHPALRALLLCLLPGIEEETSEEFERTLAIIDSIRDIVSTGELSDREKVSAVGEEYFWQCFFLATISSRSRRTGALVFLGKRLPRLLGTSDLSNGTDSFNGRGNRNQLPENAKALVSPEPGLLIRCLMSGLEDDQVLLQRGFLDLLSSHLPLSSPVLTDRADTKDVERLVGAAVGVVLRRDMSLNRRLWSWFLGPQSTADNDLSGPSNPLTEDLGTNEATPSTEYFLLYGMKPLKAYLQRIISNTSTKANETARPFRICLSLMDKLEIGGLLVPSLFVPAMDKAFAYKEASSDSDFTEILKSAGSFFDGVESGIIWGQVAALVASSLNSASEDSIKAKHKLELTLFILNNFNVREEEMVTFHIPLVALLLITLIHRREDELEFNDDIVQQALKVFEKLIALMPERAILNDSFGESVTVQGDDVEKANSVPSELILEKVHKFYTEHKGNLSITPPPFSSRTTADLLMDQTTTRVLEGLQREQHSKAATVRAKLLSSLLAKIPDSRSLSIDSLVAGFMHILSTGHSDGNEVVIYFPLLQAMTQVTGQWISANASSTATIPTEMTTLLNQLVKATWTHLSPSSPKYHVEAVRSLWQLDELTLQDRIMEASVANFVAGAMNHSHHHPVNEVDCARRFAVLWTHTVQMQKSMRRGSTKSRRGSNTSHVLHLGDTSDRQSALHRPLLLLLDSLNDDDTELQHFVVAWLESLSNLGSVIEAVLGRVIRTHATSSASKNKVVTDEMQTQLSHRDESTECLYFLRHLANLLKLPSDNVWSALAKTSDNLPFKQSQDSGDEEQQTLMVLIIQTCLEIVRTRASPGSACSIRVGASLQRTSLSIILHILQSPKSVALQQLNLDDVFVGLLKSSLSSTTMDASVRTALLDVVLASIRLNSKLGGSRRIVGGHARSYSSEALKKGANSNSADNGSTSSLHVDTTPKPPPAQLLRCVQEGVSSDASYHMLDSWVNFLIEVLPLFSESLFQSLIPLVECFCHQVQHHFRSLVASFSSENTVHATAPEPAMVALLSGLEHILAAAHERLQIEESRVAAVKTPEVAQGFFGNAVSGIFAGEAQKGRSTTANTRLTVLLCFQDAVRMCLSIWSWGYGKQENDHDSNSGASFNYVSVRLRNKSRRILDRMFGVEALECLETLIVAWVHQAPFNKGPTPPPVISLLHVLESCKPKVAMPAIFNSIYSRTNPSALDPNRASTLTSDITDVELGSFLVQYTESVDADAMDEIWADCMTFLRDVLANPLPHNTILPSLLNFLLILAEKVNNTNFGEQRKMRRELSDTFMRLLTATFTTRSASSYQETISEPNLQPNGEAEKGAPPSQKPKSLDVVESLASMVPRLPGVLQETERVNNAASSISTNVINPLMQSKHFPENMRLSHLDLLLKLSKLTQGSKAWKKDVSDAFNHAKFFATNLALAKEGWKPVLQQWVLAEKDRALPEVVTRIPAPASAGTLFGVGASNARLEGDKRAQTNLRRASLLVLAMEVDFVVPHLQIIEEKLVELLNATGASSPSSFTRADTYMLLRAIVLKTSSLHLAPIWPLISSELSRALSAISSSSSDYDTYNAFSILQACKLLDALLATAPDDFQMHEWLFITDSIDAVYRPHSWEPIALADDLAEELAATAGNESIVTSPTRAEAALSTLSRSDTAQPKTSDLVSTRKPLLAVPDTAADVGKEKFIRSTIRQFLSQLSLHSFESEYSMQTLDLEAWEDLLLRDLFCEGSLIGVRA